MSENKSVLRSAFLSTVPVLTGYLVLGFGFGIIIKATGYSIFLALAMSVFIYAGSMQYVAIGLFTGGASVITTALTTLMVNARHLFYGISMLGKYRKVGKIKPYLIFTLTDETYSLVCMDREDIPDKKKTLFYFLVSFFNHIYWILGTLIGSLVGSLIKFNSDGIDFALTALFITVFTKQWLTSKKHGPAVIGVIASVLCLLLFGGENFLIPTMFIISLILCVGKGGQKNE